MEAQGVRTDFVALESGFSRINVKLHAGEETEINGCGPEIPADKLELFLDKLRVLTPADTLVLSGSVPPSLPGDVYARIAAIAAEEGARLVVDAAGKLLLSTLPHRPFLIKPNREELSALFGAPADTDDDVQALAHRLQEAGAHHVLVSMAGDGALLCTASGESYRVAAAKGTVVNSSAPATRWSAAFWRRSRRPEACPKRSRSARRPAGRRPFRSALRASRR